MVAKKRDLDGETRGADVLRQCAVTRAQCVTDGLIRFVADPSGQIVPDLACRLPGRGVWVTADRATVHAAVTRRIFAKALGRPVETAADLAGQVGRLLRSRLASALSLANKAGGLVAGFTKVNEALEAGDVVALLHATDAADDGRAKLDRKYVAIRAQNGSPTHIIVEFPSEELGLALGRSSVVHAALIAGGAGEAALAAAVRLERYRHGQDDNRRAASAPADTDYE